MVRLRESRSLKEAGARKLAKIIFIFISQAPSPRQLLSEMSELQVKVESLTDQLANKDRRMRQWQKSKILPPRSPMCSKSPAHDRLCPSSVKRIVGADSTFLTRRSRFLEKVGTTVSQADAPGSIQRTTNKLKKTLGFEMRKPMDFVEDNSTTSFDEMVVQCSGSIRVPKESIFHSPYIQYDNPIFQEESPLLSESLKSPENNMRALSPMPVDVEPLRSRHEFSPSKPSNVSTMTLEFKNLRCTTPERQVSFLDEEPSISTPDLTHSLAAGLDSGSVTPFQQFEQKNPNLQMTLLKQYLTVLNRAARSVNFGISNDSINAEETQLQQDPDEEKNLSVSVLEDDSAKTIRILQNSLEKLMDENDKLFQYTKSLEMEVWACARLLLDQSKFGGRQILSAAADSEWFWVIRPPIMSPVQTSGIHGNQDNTNPFSIISKASTALARCGSNLTQD